MKVVKLQGAGVDAGAAARRAGAPSEFGAAARRADAYPEFVAAARRVVAAMLNIERGEEAYGPDLSERPPPWAPTPLVEVPAVTEGGLSFYVHYRASVGVVHYVAGEYSRDAFADLIEELLAQAPADHLRARRAVASTGGGVVRRPPRGGEALRQVLRESPPECGPAHYSEHAVFTWYVACAGAALKIGRRPHGGQRVEYAALGDVNSMVASVLFDAADQTRFAEGEEVYEISEGDFREPAPAGRGLRARARREEAD